MAVYWVCMLVRCVVCCIVGWIHGSYVGLLERSYRHRSHASGRVPRQYRDSNYGAGNIDIVTVVLCDHVFGGCARGSGVWECRWCRGYRWHIFGVSIVTIVCVIMFYSFAIASGCYRYSILLAWTMSWMSCVGRVYDIYCSLSSLYLHIVACICLFVSLMLAVVVVVVVLRWCRAWLYNACVWWSIMLILYVGRVAARLLCLLARMVISTLLAC